MNRPIRNIAIACLVLFAALLVNINYVQFVEADSLNAKNGNKRVINEEFSRDRGAILVDGQPVAESVKSKDEYKFQRRYPDGGLYAPLTGFFSYVYGRGGLENSQNSVLSGSDNRLFVNRVVDLVSNKQPKGGSVELTIDPLAQKAAAEGLERLGKNTKGAVVALDPQTGAILAMVNQPSYNPNRLASHDFSAVQKSWDALTKDKNQPMINRATQQTLPPGSTFKLVTAAAALENGVVDNIDDKIKAGSKLTFPGIQYTLPNENGGNCGGDSITFERALNVSCNVAFGALAGKIGQDEARRAGRQVRLRHRPARRPRRQCQPVHRRRQQARGPAARPVRHRPVRGRGDAAADGDGRGGHRQRRRRHEAVRRQDRPRAQPPGPRAGPARSDSARP